MIYIKKAKTEQQVIDHFIDFKIGGVGLATQTDEVIYHHKDWSLDYLTFEALEDGEITFTVFSWFDTSYLTSISYSLNDGEWVTYYNEDDRQDDEVIEIDVNAGDKIRCKGIAISYGYEGDNGCVITSTCRFNAYGNIMSLLYGDNFIGETDLSDNDYAFGYLFNDMNNGNECLLVNAENLILPATTLADYCYMGMFNSCTSLTTAPELPATTLTQYCYYFMFRGCTSLTTAPELPATTLDFSCYKFMFGGCTSLTTAPELPATTLTGECYSHMFDGCSSLATAPVLPATTLANGCYDSVFSGCTSLTTAPELPATTLALSCYTSMFNSCTSLATAPSLPATTLADNCYYSMFASCTSLTSAPSVLPATTLANNCYGYMFNGCRSLTKAPELPATTLDSNCYRNMFQGCWSLVKAPVLPATTLAYQCYYAMFSGCTDLNYIKCLATDISGGSTTSYWVSGVSSSGTFVKNSSMTSWTRGNNGVPSYWEIRDA